MKKTKGSVPPFIEKALKEFQIEFDRIYQGCGVGYGKNQAGLKSLLATTLTEAYDEGYKEGYRQGSRPKVFYSQ